jgi:mono/diheme cytochrome c family protein
VTLLIQCVLEEANPTRVASLLDLFAQANAQRPWLRDALLDAFTNARPAKLITLSTPPSALTALLGHSDPQIVQRARRTLNVLTWPGADAPRTLTPGAPPLNPAQQRLVDVGRETYTTLCAACHQPHGGGNPGVAPPLAGSDWVSGPPERLVRVVLHGLYGPIDVAGQRWNLHMPGFGAFPSMTDEHLAGVLSYVRRAWGNTSVPIEPAIVTSVRRETTGRTLPWRAEELGLAKSADAESDAIRPGTHGELLLPARSATTYGQKLAYRPSLDVLAPWRMQDDAAGWIVEVDAAGDYEVLVTMAADEASAGDRFRIETEGGHIIGIVLSSGGYDRFIEPPAGRLTLQPGVNRILMRPEGPLRQELADVRGLRLVPVK